MKRFHRDALEQKGARYVIVFEGVIEFDAAVRDPATPSHLLRDYDSGDHLHLGPVSYQAMADAIDLNLMTR